MKNDVLEKKILGGVIIIGSLFWENENNCMSDEVKKGKLRREWRENNLDLNNSVKVTLPIRYGRSSSSRRCTYTMIFSKECVDKKTSFGKVIPFKENFDFSKPTEFENQVKCLAEAEGLYKDKENERRYSRSWGAIALWINPKSTNADAIKNYWNNVVCKKNGYKKDSQDFKWSDGTLLTDQYYMLIELDSRLDFLLCTYIRPLHKNIQKDSQKLYPTSKEIAVELLTSNYTTYFQQNTAAEITTYMDNEIKQLIEQPR